MNPRIDDLLAWKFFRWLCQTKPNFLYELHINLGYPHKTIIDVYEGNAILEFEIIRKICDYYSIPTRLFFEEKNLNIKDIDMVKKKVKKIIPGIPDSELDPPVIAEPVEEGGNYPHLEIKCEAHIVEDDPMKKIVTPHTYEANKAFFEDCRRLAASLRSDKKTKHEIKLEIFNLVCKRLLDKNTTYDMEKINPYYLNIVEALLAS